MKEQAIVADAGVHIYYGKQVVNKKQESTLFV